MAIWLTKDSKVIVQGMTGSEGSKHTRRMLASGANVVGGVNARKAGTTVSHVDKDGNVAKNRDYELGGSDFIGQVEFDGPWPAGYQPPMIIKAPGSTVAAQ